MFYMKKANSPAFLTIKMQDIDSDVFFMQYWNSHYWEEREF